MKKKKLNKNGHAHHKDKLFRPQPYNTHLQTPVPEPLRRYCKYGLPDNNKALLPQIHLHFYL